MATVGLAPVNRAIARQSHGQYSHSKQSRSSKQSHSKHAHGKYSSRASRTRAVRAGGQVPTRDVLRHRQLLLAQGRAREGGEHLRLGTCAAPRPSHLHTSAAAPLPLRRTPTLAPLPRTPYSYPSAAPVPSHLQVTYFRRALKLNQHFLSAWTLMGHEYVEPTNTHSLTHLLTHLLTYSLTHLLTHSLTYSLTHLLTYSLTHLLTYSLTYSLTHLLTYSLWLAYVYGFD
jgi:hypothetical protein